MLCVCTLYCRCIVAVISQNLADVYVDKALSFVAGQLESSRHIAFYLRWCEHLLTRHGAKLKQRAPDIMPTVRSLQKNLTRRYNELGKMWVSVDNLTTCISVLCTHNRTYL